jgi:glycosyltransferase involved in cell wall biosynthesis
MNVLYITNARIPTEKANGVQIVKMCEAFQRQGLEVELWLPTRKQASEMKDVGNIWAHYEVDTPFRLRYLVSPDFLVLERFIPKGMLSLLHHVQSLFFALFALLCSCLRRDSVYYTRSVHVLFVFVLTKILHRKAVYFEAHEMFGDPKRLGLLRRMFSRLMSWMLRRSDAVIVITRRLRELYREFGLPDKNILVSPDGIDRKRLRVSGSHVEARQRLHIPKELKIVCYTGHLFRWKGVYGLAESGKYLPDDYRIYIVGGTKGDREALQRFITRHDIRNLVLTGYVPYSQVTVYLQAADLLVLPNSGRAAISREYTSPLKLFEYMAAQRPIVASDLPSLREILQHQDNAWLVPPDDPRTLAEGILRVMQEPTLADRLRKRAYQDVARYTWDQRAEEIKRFFETSPA